MNKIRFLLVLVIVLSIILRIFYLGKIPNGFYSDEAAYGYNAYSILQTGKDEYANFLPLAFKSFGDYKTPLYIYFLVPFVWLFGLTEFSIRLSSVVLGIGSVIVIYFLTKELFKNQFIALVSSFLAGVSPFSLQFNRMAHENNLVAFLILCGLIFFLKSLKTPNYIFPSLAAFILSIYTYHDARVFTPIFVLSLVFIYRKNLGSFKKKLLAGLFLSLILLIPFFNLLRSPAFWSRPKYTIISSDLGISLRTNEERGEDLKSLYQWPVIFHNKLISYSLTFLDNYTKHYSFDFLFFSGDPVKIYQTVGNGLLYLVSLPFLVYGLYFLFNKNIPHKWLILTWLILPPIPAALTRLVPSGSRILSIQPVLAIIAAVGFMAVVDNFKRSNIKNICLIAISCIFIFNFAYYLHYYYVNTPIRYAKEWHYGMSEVINRVGEIQDQYTKIWFSKNAWGYIYPLFYLPYPPEKYQAQARLTDLNELGFGWIEGFDKYTFADIPDKLRRSSSVLYIGSPDDFPDIKKPLYAVYYPDGHVAFYLADKSSF